MARIKVHVKRIVSLYHVLLLIEHSVARPVCIYIYINIILCILYQLSAKYNIISQSSSKNRFALSGCLYLICNWLHSLTKLLVIWMRSLVGSLQADLMSVKVMVTWLVWSQ